MVNLKRPDDTEVSMQALMDKMVEAAQAENDDPHSQLCGQETIRLANSLNRIPLIQALFYINKDIGTVLTIFFRIGYMLGRAIEMNNLNINVHREDDDSNRSDTQSNPTHSHPSSG